MNLKAVLELAEKAYCKKAKENPAGKIKASGESVLYSDAAKELRKVASFVYPCLDTKDVCQIVRCEKCKYYKKYRKKGSIKRIVKCLCSIDKIEREPDFYCKNGVEKDDQ